MHGQIHRCGGVARSVHHAAACLYPARRCSSLMPAAMPRHIQYQRAARAAAAATVLHLAGTQQHRFTYNEPIPVESCTQSLCDLALRFGEDSDEGGGMVRHKTAATCSQQQHQHHAGASPQPLSSWGPAAIIDAPLCLHPHRRLQSRPFGVALLIAGWDNNGPVL